MILTRKCINRYPICRYGIFLLNGFFLFCSLNAVSQFNVRFQLNGLPARHLPDSVFVAGNFNNWNPVKDGIYISTINDSSFIGLQNLLAGDYSFKFTRGSWSSTECQASGEDIANRILKLESDTVLHFSIEAWKDDFAPIIKTHTASQNVRILDTAFRMPQLNRTRRIWIYLPAGYAKGKKRYPVMYMQDGQNIFDNFTSGFGEWGVDECADSLVAAGKPACIIVGVDNGPLRMNEYNPYVFRDFGKGEGDLYVEFIVQTLKPFIDKHYRTIPYRNNTIIAGSSMGGLISFYAMLKYPGVFGKGGIFSPAFGTAAKIKDLTDSLGKNLTGALFFYIGGHEGDENIEEMNRITESLGRHSEALIYVINDPGSNHNEKAWQKWFPEFYNWVLANGFNNIIDPEDN